MGIESSVANKKGKESLELAKDNNPAPPRDPIPLGNTHSKGKKARRRPQKRALVVAQSPLPQVVPVQRLYNTCKKVFTSGVAGDVPPLEKLAKLRAVLDDIEPADVGLNPDMAYFCKSVAGRTPAIRYLHLHECGKFSMGIFCLPPSAVIPLHNHPGMTVFTKLLFGTMHIKSYDWVADVPPTSTVVNPSEVKQSEVEQPEVKQSEVPHTELKQSEIPNPDVKQSEIPQPEVEQLEVQQPEVQQAQVNQPVVQPVQVRQPQLRLAKVKVDSDFTAPCNSSILYPADGGNMHCFTALTACAVLDVLGPPYCDPDGRHCQYYFDFPYANFSADGISVPEEEREGYAWLQERGFPEDLAVVGGKYAGPKIVDK